MDCPVCGQTLANRIINTIALDECVHGHGLWFDHGELRKAKDEAEPAARWLDLDLWTDKDPLDGTWSTRQCPKCEKNMALISYGTTGETIDICLDEHGIWLDKGEFENIITAIEGEMYRKSAQEYLQSLRSASDP